jgi:hypothetical protein
VFRQQSLDSFAYRTLRAATPIEPRCALGGGDFHGFFEQKLNTPFFRAHNPTPRIVW